MTAPTIPAGEPDVVLTKRSVYVIFASGERS